MRTGTEEGQCLTGSHQGQEQHYLLSVQCLRIQSPWQSVEHGKPQCGKAAKMGVVTVDVERQGQTEATAKVSEE